MSAYPKSAIRSKRSGQPAVNMREVIGYSRLVVSTFVAGGVMLMLLLTGCTKGEEPRYRGRPVSEWVDLLGNYKAPQSDRGRALLAVRAIGTNTVPFLLDQVWRSETLSGFRRSGVVEAFKALGSAATPAVPTLSQIVSQTDRTMADVGVSHEATASGSGVRRASPFARYWALRSLKELGTNAHRAVPAMLSALRSSEDYNIAFEAARGAAKCALKREEVLPFLMTNLVEGSTVCQWASAWGLEALGSGAKEAVSPLRMLLGHTNPIVCQAASNALASIEGGRWGGR